MAELRGRPQVNFGHVNLLNIFGLKIIYVPFEKVTPTLIEQHEIVSGHEKVNFRGILGV